MYYIISISQYEYTGCKTSKNSSYVNNEVEFFF